MTSSVASPTAPVTALPAAAPQAAPAAAPASGLLGLLTKRTRPINPEELMQAAMAAQTAMSTVGAWEGDTGTAGAEGSAAPAGAATGAATLGAPAAAAGAATAPAASTAAAAATPTAATPAATQSVQSSQFAAIAPRKEHDYWQAHIAQFSGPYLPDGPAMRPNCGPASVTTALRLIGLDIPGFNGERSNAVLDQARIIGTGKNDYSVGTTDTELERMIEASGARWSESNNLGEMLGWVREGVPVILAGNPINSWNQRYSSDQVYPYDGGHWVTVSGYDEASGHYIVNDPLSQIGPILVSESELQTYMNSHGGLGIAVFR